MLTYYVRRHFTYFKQIEPMSVVKNTLILLDFSLSVKAAPHECEIRASQP